MKKILILLVISVLSVTIVACGLGEKNNEASDPIEKVEISLSIDEIIDEMYVSSGLEWPNTMKTQLSEENLQYMLGLETLDFIEGTASEPMMSSQAHSIVLFK